MQDLKLYTSRTNLKLALATGAATMALGFYLPMLGDTATVQSGIDMQIVGIAANIGGLWLMGRGVLGLYRPRPVFHGTRDGFSVNGKKMRPWSEFRGVVVKSMSYSFIGIGKFLRIKVGKTLLGGHIQINPLQLSGPAIEMMTEIESYARHAKRADELTDALSDIPAKPLVGHVAGQAGRRRANPVPTAPVAAMPLASKVEPDFNQPRPVRTPQTAAGGGPVQSVPSFGERLFGRHKVL